MKGFSALTGALAALLLACTASAAPKVPDGSFETTTSATAIPSDPGGSVTVYACTRCPPKLARLTPQSEFLIGKRLVSFEEFRDYVNKRGPLTLAVIYEPRQGSVTRLVVGSR